MRRSSIISIILAGTLSACATVVPVGRPPSGEEIARINDAVEHSRGLVVETPVLLRGPAEAPSCASGWCGPPVEPLERCAAGSCAQTRRPAVHETARSIISADDREITFATKRGTQLTLPLETVRGVKVTGADRPGGAVVGVIAGMGVDLAVGALLLALSNVNLESDPGAPMSQGCTSKCEQVLAVGALVPLVVGGIIGWSIGAPRRYAFGGAPTVTAP